MPYAIMLVSHSSEDGSVVPEDCQHQLSADLVRAFLCSIWRLDCVVYAVDIHRSGLSDFISDAPVLPSP